MAEQKPLVLDIDGTFLKTDMLFESFWAGLGKEPVRVLRSVLKNWRKPAKLKIELAEIANIRTELLPVNADLLALTEKCRSEGREVILASASTHELVARLSADHGLSDRVFASTEDRNLKGQRKADALVKAFGEQGFDYAGDNKVDRAIWLRADNALVVGSLPEIEKELINAGKSVTNYASGWQFGDLLRGMRPIHWTKNALLLLPVLMVGEFSISTMMAVLLGVVAFSLATASMYIVDDLLDLQADRIHPTKKPRPFASGAVPIQVGMVASTLLALLALVISSTLGIGFFAAVIAFMATSLVYSIWLKRFRWVDIGALAVLNSIRVVAGAMAAQLAAFGPALVFVFLIYSAIACASRLTTIDAVRAADDLRQARYAQKHRKALLLVAGLCVAAGLLIILG